MRRASIRGRLLVAAACAAVFLLHALYLECVAEDAFISFRFARNWAEGHGLVWNSGGTPVEGYTNFLWVAIAAGLYRLGADLPTTMQLLGVIAGLLTLAYVLMAARRLERASVVQSFVPAGALVIAGPFATWAASGLETVLFTLFVTASIAHLCLWLQDRDPRQRWACAAALLAAMLTRPEGALVAGLLLVLGLAGARSGAARRALCVAAGACALVFAAYFSVRWSYFGQLLPNTFYAKTGGGLAQLERGLAYSFYFAKHYGLPWLPALALAAAWGSPRPSLHALREPIALLRRRPLPVVSLVVAAVYCAYVASVGGDYMAMYRFFVPILPCLAWLLGTALCGLVTVLAEGAAGRRAAVALALLVAVLGTLVHSTPFEEGLFEKPPRMHGNWRGVQTERWHVGRLSSIGIFFASYGAGSQESIGTDAIGAIGWYSKLGVYGLHGLVDPEVAQRPVGEDFGSGLAGHERGDLAHLFSKRPTFFLVSRQLYGKPVRALPPPGQGVDDLLARDYRSAWYLIRDEDNDEEGYFAFIERRDRGQLPGAQRRGGKK